MNAAAIVLALILGAPHTLTDDAAAAVADAIAIEAHEAPLWDVAPDPEHADAPDPGEAATAVLLAAIGRHESGWRQDVRDCRRAGDQGRSVGLYQLMRGRSWDGHSRVDICSDDRTQARLALAVLRRSREQCRRCAPAFWIRAYASGNGGLDTPAARRIANGFALAAARSGLVVDPYSTRAPRWKEGPS